MNRVPRKLKKAKEKGFDEECNHVLDEGEVNQLLYYQGDGSGVLTNSDVNNTSTGDEYECTIPTYHQLIDWVFDSVKLLDVDEPVDCPIEWLEFWYNLLKDCPLKYEFTGRLLNWFRNNNLHLSVTAVFVKDSCIHRQIPFTYYDTKITGQTNKYPIVYSSTHSEQCSKIGINYDTYEEAEDDGILKMFKLLKDE